MEQLSQALFVLDLVNAAVKIATGDKKNLKVDGELQELSNHEAWQMLQVLVRSKSVVVSLEKHNVLMLCKCCSCIIHSELHWRRATVCFSMYSLPLFFMLKYFIDPTEWLSTIKMWWEMFLFIKVINRKHVSLTISG